MCSAPVLPSPPTNDPSFPHPSSLPSLFSPLLLLLQLHERRLQVHVVVLLPFPSPPPLPTSPSLPSSTLPPSPPLAPSPPPPYPSSSPSSHLCCSSSSFTSAVSRSMLWSCSASRSFASVMLSCALSDSCVDRSCSTREEGVNAITRGTTSTVFS